MAKILLVSMYDVNADGLRILSANLKQKGHQSFVVFFKKNGYPYNVDLKYIEASKEIKEKDWVGINDQGEPFRYSRGPDPTPKEEELLISLLMDICPDVIGFTVTTPFVKTIDYLSKLIKKNFNAPIIWGGPAPTTDPETCLKFCDLVCIGEGEKAIIDIADKIDNNEEIKSINNLAYIKDDRLHTNPLNPLFSNLDELPFRDIAPENKFLIEDNYLKSNFTEIGYRGKECYHTTSSRGCPFSCSYCCENFFKGLYSKEIFLRRRTPSNLIKELEIAKNDVDYKVVQFEDDVFSTNDKWLKEFGEMYKQKINVPFSCYIFANRDIENRLIFLKGIGLFYTCLSVQSGSKRINKEIFNRPFDKNLFLETAHILKELEINYYVDVITYNPFETRKDLKATLNILTQLPKPFGLCVNKLYPIKGTKIYSMLNDPNNSKEIKPLAERTFNYYSRLFFLTATHEENTVNFVHKLRIFEYFPSLLNMYLNWLDERSNKPQHSKPTKEKTDLAYLKKLIKENIPIWLKKPLRKLYDTITGS